MLATTTSQPPGTSGGSEKRRTAPTKTTSAITISETALTSAARISARRRPKLRLGVAGRRASITAPAATLSATTSERLCPASASSDRLPAASAAIASNERVRGVEDERDRQRPQRAAAVVMPMPVLVVVVVRRSPYEEGSEAAAGQARAAVWENAANGLHPARHRRRPPRVGRAHSRGRRGRRAAAAARGTRSASSRTTPPVRGRPSPQELRDARLRARRRRAADDPEGRRARARRQARLRTRDGRDRPRPRRDRARRRPRRRGAARRLRRDDASPTRCSRG